MPENASANTNWPIRPSFPVFVGNVLTYLGGAAGSKENIVVEPGQSIALRSETPATQLTIESPMGQTSKIRRGPQSTFVFSNTDKQGVYKVREGSSKEVSQLFSVNLFDPSESNIIPRSDLPTGYIDVESSESWEPARQETWKYLLGLALLVLLFEWYIYNRRVYL